MLQISILIFYRSYSQAREKNQCDIHACTTYRSLVPFEVYIIPGIAKTPILSRVNHVEATGLRVISQKTKTLLNQAPSNLYMGRPLNVTVPKSAF